MTTEQKIVFGSNIARLRKQKKLKQNSVAELIGVSTNYLCMLEKGKRECTIDTLLKLSRVLGADINQIFNGVDKVSTQN